MANVWRRRVGAVALAALAAASVSPAEVRGQPAKPAQIDRNGVLILIRSTLLALDHANKTGNYTVLRDLAAPSFQVANSAARLGEIFAGHRKDRLDLSGVAALEPQLSLLPQIEPGGQMHLAGFFPSAPTQINFELSYAPVDGQWRLFGVSVALGQSAPAAPVLAPQASMPELRKAIRGEPRKPVRTSAGH
jgi:hypothetical protein